MEQFLFLVSAFAALAIIYASNRSYVKHYCDVQLSSRRNNSYWQLVVAIFLLAFAAYFSTTDIVISYAVSLLIIFGSYTMLKVSKHKKCARMQGISRGAKRYHLSIVGDYITWFFMAAGSIILATIILAVIKTVF